ncbi:Protein P80 [Sarcoptes scabiei]|nr:Protein P80 [Sarcoptes scabiei]
MNDNISLISDSMRFNAHNESSLSNQSILMEMMKMYFHTEIGSDHILFKFWKPKTAKDLLIACLITIVLTIFYECLKFIREFIRSKQIESGSSEFYLDPIHFIQSFLHGAQFLLSYCLMLIAMTFQVYLFGSIILGAMLGHLIFQPLIYRLHLQSADFADPCCS